jgi:hypothetical protein
MNKTEKAFLELLGIFKKENLFPYVMIVGSWAEYVYEKSTYLHGFSKILKTFDIDILWENIRKPPQKIELIKTLKNNHFLIETHQKRFYSFSERRN